ncbi:MAG: hypothetical protein VKJ24_09395, partial [Synechococcales bacterium]|nr:hypothetical protein [Synechococcales bacterium]
PIQALNFFADGNDIMAGGAGEDSIFGQRGNDTLTGDAGNDYIEGNAGNDAIDGGEGDDFLMGDNGDNLSPTHADLPRVTHGYHVIEKAAGVTASFDRFGTILIPKLSLVPQPFLDFVPNFTLVPPVPQDTPIPTIAPLTLPNGVSLKPLMEILPDLNHHVGLLQGNDRIRGSGGKDTIVGDNTRHFMPLRTGIAALDQQFDELVTRFNHLQYDLKDLELAATTGQAAQTLSFGNDLIDGGSDRDSVMADNLTYYSPLVLQPNAATPAIAQTVSDLLLAVGRFSGAVNRLLQPFPSATPAITLSTGNDVVNGGDGNDKLFGADTLIISPVLNDLTYAKGSFWNYGFNRTPHAVRPTFREFDLNLNNDDMRGGNENDLIVGGFTSLIAPIVNRVPVTQNERTILSNSLNILVRDVKDLIRDLHQEQYGINYVNRNQTNVMVAENDLLNGEAGADILTGDNATLVLPILQGQPDLNFALTGGSFDVSAEPYNFAHTLAHQHEFIYRNTGGGQTTFGQDTLLGGIEDDILLGGQFRDRLFGEAGNDFLAGGRDADLLDGGTGTNTVRSTSPSPADQVRLQPTIDANLQELISPTLARAIAEIAATNGDIPLQGDFTQAEQVRF